MSMEANTQTPGTPAPTPVENPASKAADILKTVPATDGAAPVDADATKEGEAPKEDKFSSKFAALARRERKIQEREAKTKEIETKYADFEKREASRKQTFQADPFKFIKDEFGMTYNDLTNLLLNDNKPTAEMLAKRSYEEVEALKTELKAEKEAEAKKAEEKAKAEAEQGYQATIKQFMGEITGFISENTDAFELTSLNPDGAELIYNVIEQHHEETHRAGKPRVMSVKEAAEAVEAYLEEEAKKLLAAKKFKAKDDASAQPGKPGQTQAHKTLTNSQQASSPTPQAGQPKSIEESKAEAAKSLRWI